MGDAEGLFSHSRSKELHYMTLFEETADLSENVASPLSLSSLKRSTEVVVFSSNPPTI